MDEILTFLEEGDIPIQLQNGIDIYIQPPNNANDDVTDEDSGEEDNPTVNNLPGNQLLAPAELSPAYDEPEHEVCPVSGLQNEGTHTQLSSLDCNITENDESPEQPPKKARKLSTKTVAKQDQSINKKPKKQKFTYNWCNDDLPPDQTIWYDRQEVRNNLTPLEHFFLFFDDDVFSLLVDKTNRYAALRNRLGDVSQNEMKCFIGVLLLSGYVQLPRRRLLWETSLDTHNELVSRSISRDRFEFIMSNLHTCDNDNLEKSDKYAKVRPLYDALNKNFFDNAPHEENHSLDESMVPYFGRHSLKQFIRNKPIRYGYKIWVGATTNGYVIWKDPYQGKSQTLDPDYVHLGLGASVVLNYCDVLRKNGNFPFHVFFDNFFGGLPLLQELKNKNIRATCTMREDRIPKCPLENSAIMKKRGRGTLDYKTEKDKNIIIAKWNDNSIVTVASNVCGVQPMQQVKRYSQHEKKHVLIPQPNLINLYNKKMGGVDRFDQNVSLYRIQIRGKKWYFPLISDCIDSAEQNAWQLHRISGGKLDHLAFRRRLACNLLETYGKGCSSKAGRSSKNCKADSRFDRLDHLVVPQEKQTRCGMCHSKCTTRCQKCDVGLHTKCFISYHTKP